MAMTDKLLAGIDVSGYQNPTVIRWDDLAKTHQFVICRATYGTSLDKHVTRHVAEVRRAALTLGLYHFWTVHRRNEEQLRAFETVARMVHLGDGDLVPAVDIEDHPQGKVCPEWSDRLHAFCTTLTGQYGRCLIYCTQRDWARLGKPEWLLEHPLWVAHWGVKEPAMPGGRPWVIWQHKVAPLPGVYGQKIDQNRARLPLPTIGNTDWLDRDTRREAEAQVALTVDDAARGEFETSDTDPAPPPEGTE